MVEVYKDLRSRDGKHWKVISGDDFKEGKEMVIRVKGVGGIKVSVIGDKVTVNYGALLKLINTLANRLNLKVEVEEIEI